MGRRMTLAVLNVAYSLARVGPDAVGGAEQVVHALDGALAADGAASLVVACEGSATTGELYATPAPPVPFDDGARRAACEAQRRAIERALGEREVSLVHMHGVDFHRSLPPPGVPVLVTLHLPPAWYPPEIFRIDRPDTWLHCVSPAQARACPDSAPLLPPIENGVAVERFGALTPRRDRMHALALGRICPEKGYDVALDAARRAGAPMLLAGRVFPYAEHQRYFSEEIVPRLDAERRFIGAASFERKRRLLSTARCLLVPSRAPETSSLVAMEALACGTPVIAFPVGALAEIVEHGRTGFLVHDEREMADAIAAAEALEPEECRDAARTRFSRRTMLQRYLQRYAALAAH
ncbi:MAG TPA: glycosyltransferase [Gemmatimonadaceae bacterium]|nr:glycosyltransferase [Gemmatimonadaceae bacterium]